MRGYLCGRMAEYQNGCRCTDCTSAKAARLREYRQEVRGRLTPGDPRHGTASGYDTYGCRCMDCRRVNAARKADYKARQRRAENYMPPDDDVDEIAVVRALEGQYPYTDLTIAERVEVARRSPLSASELAQLLGVAARTVVRLRARGRESGEATA